MTTMSARIIVFFISLSVLRSATQDTRMLRGKSGGKSNKVLVKYEGTLDEVKAYCSGLGLEFQKAVFKNWYVFTIPQADSLSRTDVPDLHLDLKKEQQRDRKVKFIQQEMYVMRRTRSMVINDEKWSEQWHLQPAHTPNMNVYKAWEKGYTGAGVNVTFIDDGIDTEHPDLKQNYNPVLSFDYIENTDDPSHKHPMDRHGSNSAGVVGASNNTNCVIGIANEISMGAVRLIVWGGFVTPSDEALALTHKFEYVDIYSNSWGNIDDGMTMDSLHEMLQDAFELTIKEGRNGKGVIYTWASGNGGDNDNCNADLYSSSMYTIAIAAVEKSGSRTYYSEPCTSILAATFSGSNMAPNITTTGPNGTCVDDFSGTSAACPMATGIIALTLQANPDLTWRDVQHMIVEYSNISALDVSSNRFGNYEFYTNGAGKQVSIYGGFGLMDAKAMVDNAPTWSTVPPRISCTSGDIHVDRTYHEKTVLLYNFTDCYIQFLEHVEVTVMYNASYRGAVEFYLGSPMQTESLLFSSRLYDNATTVVEHQFMSVHTWGENPHGVWLLTMFPVTEDTEMHLYEWGISIFGTATDPLRGIPSAGTFGSPCNSTSTCASVVDGGCLKDRNKMCDNICIPCKNGYHLNGDFCEKDCPPLVSVSGSYILLNNESGLTVARYNCYPEFGFTSMTGNRTRTCGADGKWTGSEPTCNLIDCGPLPNPVNGRVLYFETTYDSVAYYDCVEGFTVRDGDDERWCSLDGKWNGTEPTCSPVEPCTYERFQRVYNYVPDSRVAKFGEDRRIVQSLNRVNREMGIVETWRRDRKRKEEEHIVNNLGDTATTITDIFSTTPYHLQRRIIASTYDETGDCHAEHCPTCQAQCTPHPVCHRECCCRPTNERCFTECCIHQGSQPFPHHHHHHQQVEHREQVCGWGQHFQESAGCCCLMGEFVSCIMIDFRKGWG